MHYSQFGTQNLKWMYSGYLLKLWKCEKKRKNQVKRIEVINCSCNPSMQHRNSKYVVQLVADSNICYDNTIIDEQDLAHAQMANYLKTSYFIHLHKLQLCRIHNGCMMLSLYRILPGQIHLHGSVVVQNPSSQHDAVIQLYRILPGQIHLHESVIGQNPTWLYDTVVVQNP